MIAHNVYFTLKAPSEPARQSLLAACKRYLTDHPGVVFFACGVLEPSLDRPVNVRDFDVALHVVFDTIESHDIYQEAPRHLQFVQENRDSWASVRVFDSTVD
jgi:hypothetical protein